MRTALILAGGESSRFGNSKACALFRGRPMVRWVADVLVSRSDELLVSTRNPDEAGRLRPILPEARFVSDARQGRGPIEGFARGFAAAHGGIVLVAPCDAPLLRAPLYDLLLAALGDHEAAVPRIEVLDPVRAVYRKDAVLRAMAGRAPESPSSLVDSLRTVFLGADALREADPSLSSFADVNREEDLCRAGQDRDSDGLQSKGSWIRVRDRATKDSEPGRSELTGPTSGTGRAA